MRDPVKMWRLTKWARTTAQEPPPPPQFPPIQDRDAELSMSQEVTADEILSILKTIAPDKAPGPDSIPNRFLPLLNALGKVLEKIVARMGARPGRSTITALEMLTEQIRTAWANDSTLVASMLSLDISGAFDNVSHERLIHNLRNARLPRWVGEYIRSFLTGRTTTLMLGTYEDRVRSTTSGIPQGSTLSPILFLFLASTLLPQLIAGATNAVGFVDDTNILTFSRSTEANCRTLERANEKCMAWARTHGATFAPEKYQLLHFTRRPKKFNMQATVRIPNFQDGPVTVMRIPGIHLDSKLKWGPHVNLTAAKAASHMTSITRLTKSTWGATFAKARQIYAAVVRPVLSYGCPVWFFLGDERANQNRLIYPLQTVQNKCLRSITGAYKTTNIQVLEHEASVSPLDLHLEMLAVNHVQRSENTAGNRAVEEARKAIDQRAQWRFRTKGNRPKARWIKYQKQTRALANDGGSVAVASRATWTQGLRTKENLTRAESTFATLLRTEHVGLDDYLCRRRYHGYPKPDCSGWPRQTPKHIILFCTAHASGLADMLAEAKTTDYTKLLSTSAGLRAMTKWFLQRDVLAQSSLARTMDEAKPRHRGRRPGTYVDENDGER
ncbi:hypothetical protein KC316_g5942 [Hortaea werneckii]|nr:hypothetical protein KC324_g5655 [Hortaea werneckii]KAI7585835.1 hypothetical protein KC316_g5942 [Hortaea werneckii]